MSRLSSVALALLILGGVVAAIVRAQDMGSRQPADQPTRPAAAESRHDPQVKLVQHLQNIGQSITAEYQGSLPSGDVPVLNPPGDPWAAQPGLLLAANDAQAAGEVRSILTRRTAVDGNKPATASVAGPTAQTQATAEPSASLSRPAGPPLTSEPGLLPADGTAAPSGPASGTGSRVSTEAKPPEGYRTSSRRTFQTPDSGGSPAAVASKPVTAQPTGSSDRSTVISSSDTLSSTTGALLRVATVGPSALTLGAPAQISIRLSNLGSTDAQGVSIRVSIPAGLEMIAAEVDDGSTRMQRDAASSTLVWSIDQVPARAERVLNLKAIPRSTEPVNLGVDWSVAAIATVSQIQIQEPRLELALRGPSELVYGETKVFTVVVTNPGTGEARDVSLRLALGEQSADSLQVGTIAAGASREFDVEVTARQAGAMQIVAAAVGAPELKAEAQTQIQIRQADLRIETLGSPTKYAGSVGTYQVRVVNSGDASAENVQAAVRLPVGSKYVEGLENVQQEGADLKWAVGSLGPGEERIFRFFCQLSDEGAAQFEFLVRGDGGLQASGTVLTQVQSIADLKMLVNDPKGPVPVGQEVVYEIQVINRGTKAATQIQLIAQFSEGVEPVSVEGARGDLVPGQVVFQPIARLNAGETIKLTVRAKADRDGNHLFRAELRCTDPEYRLVAEDTTTFYGDDLMASPVKPAETSPSDANPAPQPLTSRPAGWTTR